MKTKKRLIHLIQIALLGFFTIASTPLPTDATSQSSSTRGFWEALMDWASSWGSDSEEETLINNGNPVPEISDDDQSASFVTERIAEDALVLNNESYSGALDTYQDYAANLTKTLSQLSLDEQQHIFYGK